MSSTNSDLKAWNDHPMSYIDLHAEKNDLFKKKFDTPAFVSMLGNIKNKKILDLGCGNGDLCKVLWQHGGAVIGLDGGENMLKEAKKNFSECFYILCDLMTNPIPFPVDYFDLVTAKMLLDVVASVETVSLQALKVLKSKGLYAIEIPHPMRPYVKRNKNRYIGIDHYEDVVPGKIKFSSKNFSYYHRSISYYINTMIDIGFSVRKVQEIRVNDEFVKLFPDQKDKKVYPISWQILFEKI